MNVQPTSIEAYRSLNLGARQQVVLDFVRDNPDSCNLDISVGLGLPINSITPRIHELRKLQKIRFSKYKTSPTGRRSMAWTVGEIPKELF